MTTYDPLPPDAIHPKQGDKVTWKNKAGRNLSGVVVGMFIGSPNGWGPHDTYAEIRTFGLKTRPVKFVPWHMLKFA